MFNPLFAAPGPIWTLESGRALLYRSPNCCSYRRRADGSDASAWRGGRSWRIGQRFIAITFRRSAQPTKFW